MADAQEFPILTATAGRRVAAPSWSFVPFAAFMALLLFILPFTGTGSSSDVEAEGSAFKQLFVLICMGLAAATFWCAPAAVKRVLRANALLLLFYGYLLLSCLWSPIPDITFRRWIVTTTLLACIVAARAAPAGSLHIVNVLRGFTAVGVAASLLLPSAIPSPQFFMEDGEWRGVFMHKNTLGSVCTLTFAVWLPTFRLDDAIAKTAARVVLLAVAALLIVKSQCATALAVSTFLVCMHVVTCLPISRMASLVGAGFLAVLACFYFFNFAEHTPLEMGLQALGRDQTLTGRTDLWNGVLRSVRDHPLVGVGYGAFWAGEAGLSARYIADDFTWRMNQSHNGYLDILNELGAVGLLFFLALLAAAFRRALAFPDRTYLLVLAGVTINNMVETSFCRENSIGWIAFLTVFVGTTTLGARQPPSYQTPAPYGYREQGANTWQPSASPVGSTPHAPSGGAGFAPPSKR